MLETGPIKVLWIFDCIHLFVSDDNIVSRLFYDTDNIRIISLTIDIVSRLLYDTNNIRIISLTIENCNRDTVVYKNIE